MGLSTLGIIHTLIGVIALVAGIVSLVQSGFINLARNAGRIYFYGTVIAALTALGLTKHGFPNPGHFLSLLVFIFVVISFLLYRRRRMGGPVRFMETLFLSLSFFLSWLPTVNETLTRVPVGHPLAKDISDPLVGNTLLVVFVIFVTGLTIQFLRHRKSRRVAVAQIRNQQS